MTPEVEAVLRTLPRKVKVGAYDYRIRLHEKLTEDDNWGDYDTRAMEINIYGTEEMPSAVFLVGVVLHELLHAIWAVEIVDLVGDGDHEEYVVSNFETGLVSLFRDNPKLLTWFKRGLK